MTATADVTSAGAVLFDLDGVLIDTDAFTELVQRLLVRRPWRLLPAAALVLARLLVPHHSNPRLELNRRLVRLALRGLDETGYIAHARLVGHTLGHGSRSVPDLIDQAAQHRSAGSRVIVVTATEQNLARAVLDSVGLDDAELIGTTVQFPPTRRPAISVYNVGEQKVIALQQLEVDLSSSLLYTDSAADLPLIRRVGRCVLVGPDRRTISAVEQAGLGSAVTVRSRRPSRGPGSRS